MIKVRLNQGYGVHYQNGVRVKPGEECEVPEKVLAAFPGRFERLLSSAELAEMAEKRAKEEAKRADAAKALAAAESKKADDAAKKAAGKG